MAENRQSSDDAGCLLWLVGLVVLALVVAGIISLAAIVDPFNWMPSVSEVWADCQARYGSDDCDLANRFPGFWLHAGVNLLWILATGALLVMLGMAVADYRKARPERFSDADAAKRYTDARHMVMGSAALVAVAAAVPIVVAIF